MWAPFVVVVGPFGDRRSGVIEAEEQGFVEELVAHAGVEALAKAVLHRLAGRDVVPFHPMFLRSGEDGVRGEFGAVIGDDLARLAAAGDQLGQFARHPAARD